MPAKKYTVRHGFSYYLTVSFCLHISFMVLFSFVKLPAPELDIEAEVMPVRIQTRAPLQRPLEARLPGWLDPGEYREFESPSHSYAPLSRLPEFLRSAPRPDNPPGYVTTAQLTPVSVEREEFEVAEKPVRPEKIVKVEEQVTSEAEPEDEEKEAVVMDSADDFMPLDNQREVESRRQLINRPVFPYARLSNLLPARDIRVEFKLTVAKSGRVAEAAVIRNTQNEELDRELIKWMKRWEYEPSEQRSEIDVSIEIPAE